MQRVERFGDQPAGCRRVTQLTRRLRSEQLRERGRARVAGGALSRRCAREKLARRHVVLFHHAQRAERVQRVGLTGVILGATETASARRAVTHELVTGD
jgi:hypothetical protein